MRKLKWEKEWRAPKRKEGEPEKLERKSREEKVRRWREWWGRGQRPESI